MRRVRPLLVVLLALRLPAAAHGQTQTPTPPSVPQIPGVSSPFLGGVPAGEPSAQPIALSIADAINRALEHNLGVLTAEQALGRAQGARWTALSDVLPNVNGHVSESRQLVNLAAFGFPLPPGTPAIVGPFNVFDARVNLTAPVLDFRALNALRAESHTEAAARYAVRSARDLVVLVAANAYLQALAAGSRADAAQAQLETAQALLRQAEDLKASGMIPGIGVLRAQVELSTQQQRATATKNDAEKAKLQLARVIGLPMGQAFTLTDQLPYAPVPEMTLEQALERAYAARPDYQAALERLHAAESSRAAAKAEWLPSLRVNADYGDIGLTIPESHYTYTLAGSLVVPIFNGNRTRGRQLQAEADVRTREAEAADMKSGIYYDVRTAFLDLQATREQLDAATRGRDLAAAQLTQARDRFAAGVADNLEVVQAQEAVAVANEQYIAGLYSFNVSKAALARALGVAEQAARQYLGGSR